MRLIPHFEFKIQTDMNTGEALAALSQVIQGKKFWPNPFSANRRRFEGVLSNDSFRMTRNTYYANSFLPLISGKVSSSGAGSVIDISMDGNPCVLLSLMAGFAFFGFILTAVISAPISNFAVIAGTLGGVILGYAGYHLGFGTQVVTDRQSLVDLFRHK